MKPDMFAIVRKNQIAITALTIAVLAIVASSPPRAATAADEGEFELYEWSVFNGMPNQDQLNAQDRFPNALPTMVESPRTFAAGRGETGLAPITVLSFSGKPAEEVDINLRVNSGRIVAHWPKGAVTDKRLRWLHTSLMAATADDARLGFVSPDHWFQKARELDHLFVKVGSRAERFLAYDAELRTGVPISLTGGPDNYQVVNSSNLPLYDIVVVAPSDQGRRIGWVASAPAAPKAAPPPPDTVVEADPDLNLAGHMGAVRAAAFSGPGNLLATAGDDGTIRIWQLPSGQVQSVLAGHEGPVRALAFSPDGGRLFSGGDDKTCRMWEPRTGQALGTIGQHASAVTALAVGSGGQWLVVGTSEGRMAHFNPVKNEPIGKTTTQAHKGEVCAISISADNRFAITAGDDHAAKIWAPPRGIGGQRGAIKGHQQRITGVACVPGSQSAVTGSRDGTVRFWNDKREEQASLKVEGQVESLSLSRDGKLLAIGTHEPDGAALYEFASRRKIANLRGLSGSANAVSISPDGNYLAVASGDGAVRVWNLTGDKLRPTPPKPVGTPVEIAMSAPLAGESAELAAQTTAALSTRLTAAGLPPADVEMLVSIYAKPMFGAKELVVLYRLSPDAIEEMLPLDVYPEPRKRVRVALVLVGNIDPRVQIEMGELVARLGNATFREREAAEKRLRDLGAVAFPVLRTALNNADPEIAYRAERLLLDQQQPLDAAPAGAPGGQAAAPVANGVFIAAPAVAPVAN